MLVEHPVDISFIMPMYNAERYVGDAINSVFEQEYDGNIELIIVDDASEDSSFEIAQTLAKADPRILVRLISQEHTGVAIARNTGLAYAAGDYIAFLDADDQLMPGFCSCMLNAAHADNADLVIGGRKKLEIAGDMRFQHSDDVLCFGYSRHRAPYMQVFLADLFWTHDLGNSVWNKLYKKELLGEFSARQYYEDYPFNLDYIARSNTITTLSKIVYCYRAGMGTAIDDTRYAGCGWEAQVVEDYVVRQFIESLSGKPLSEDNLVKSDAQLFRRAEAAIAGGTDESVVTKSNRYMEALERTFQTS